MTEPDKIPTSLRTLRILEVIAASETALTPTEINARLGLPKQTAHRLCTRLVAEGFIAYVPGGKRLRPARRLRALAAGLMSASQVHIARHQVLEDVARQVGETVNFVVPEEHGMSYLDRVETGWAFRVQLPIGTHVPFHCTASGKTWLASLPRERRAKVVSALRLDRLSANTITSAPRLLEELEQIAAQGHGIDNEEFVDGMVAIAVPVVDADGRFLAALAFHGPCMRLTLDKLLDGKPVLLEAARRLSAIMMMDD
jgi:DNA-binding IclR family transcriptional regulator